MEIRKYIKEIIPDVIDFEKKIKCRRKFLGLGNRKVKKGLFEKLE